MEFLSADYILFWKSVIKSENKILIYFEVIEK